MARFFHLKVSLRSCLIAADQAECLGLCWLRSWCQVDWNTSIVCGGIWRSWGGDRDFRDVKVCCKRLVEATILSSISSWSMGSVLERVDINDVRLEN